jgi:hypothetical protein
MGSKSYTQPPIAALTGPPGQLGVLTSAAALAGSGPPLLPDGPDPADRNDRRLSSIRPRPVVVRRPRHLADEAPRMDRDRLSGIEARAAIAPPHPDSTTHKRSVT